MCFVLVSSGMMFSTPRLSCSFTAFAFFHSSRYCVKLSRMQDLSSYSLLLECLYDRSLIQMFLILCYWTKHLKPSAPRSHLFFFIMYPFVPTRTALSNINRAWLTDVLLKGLIGWVNLEFKF